HTIFDFRYFDFATLGLSWGRKQYRVLGFRFSEQCPECGDVEFSLSCLFSFRFLSLLFAPCSLLEDFVRPRQHVRCLAALRSMISSILSQVGRLTWYLLIGLLPFPEPALKTRSYRVYPST